MSVIDNPIIKKLLSLKLPTSDYVIFGSGPMFAHGIKDLGHDVDVVARGAAWKRACSYSFPTRAGSGVSNVVILFEGQVEIFDSWYPGKWDIGRLIDEADEFDGIKFVKLKDMIRWKKSFGRPKDIQHIKMIEDHLKSKKCKVKR